MQNTQIQGGKKQKQKPDKQIDEDFDKLFALFNRNGERQYEREREKDGV